MKLVHCDVWFLAQSIALLPRCSLGLFGVSVFGSTCVITI